MRYLVIGAGGHAQEVAWSLVEHERGRGASCELLFFDDAVAPGPLPSGPGAVVGPNVEIGHGSYVAAGAIVTLNGRLEPFVTINLHAQVAHDCVVERHATLHPNARIAGAVRVGEGAELGTNSAVLPGLAVGDWAVLGAGAIVVEALAEGGTYVGVPARPVAGGDAQPRRA